MATSPISGTSSLDVNAIVGQLMQIEARPLTALAQKEAGITSRIAAVARVQGAVSVLQGAATRLSQTATWNGARATVGGEGLTAAVTDSTKAALGTYSIKVTTLAAAPALASGQFASSAEALGTGTLRLQVGSNPAKDITIDSTNNTLAGIRDAINAAGAGVSAALVTDGGQVRLTLIGSATGAANAIKLTVQEAGSTFGDAVNLDATGLSRLSFDPAIALTPPATTASGRQMQQTRAAADAAFEVNGLALTATSNAVTGAIDGVTLDLKKASADALTQVTISRDTASMSGAVNDFIKAYNDLDKTLKDVTKFDASSKKGAVLNGDATMRSLQSQVRALVRADQSAASSGDFARLSQIGIEVNRDGTLTLNSSKFDAATADPAKLSRLFTTTNDVREEARGFGVRFKDLAERLVGSEGSLPSRTKSLQSQIESINEQEERWNLRLQQIEARLRRQYTALDAQLAGLQGQSSSLANALSQLPGASRG